MQDHLDRHQQQRDDRQEQRVAERELDPRERERGQRRQEQRDDGRRDGDLDRVQECLEHGLRCEVGAQHELVVVERQARGCRRRSSTSRCSGCRRLGRNEVTSRPTVGQQPDERRPPRARCGPGSAEEPREPFGEACGPEHWTVVSARGGAVMPSPARPLKRRTLKIITGMRMMQHDHRDRRAVVEVPGREAPPGTC